MICGTIIIASVCQTCALRKHKQRIVLSEKEVAEIQMGAVTDDNLIYEILSVVEEIPSGRVATYCQIARLIGRDKNARLIGTVLSRSAHYGQYPCHRVVNHAGRLVPGWWEQAELLNREGVSLKENDHVDLKKYQWKI